VRIAILGAGAWGTALAISLSNAHEVRLWTRTGADREALRATRRSRYLPEVELPPAVAIASAVEQATGAAELVIAATSTAGLRETCGRLVAAGSRAPLLWACKGFEAASGLFAHEVVAQALPHDVAAGALSGPSFALEVARGLPAALVLASRDAALAARTAAALNSPRLRIYSSTDVVGVELGGAVKNVIAIAAGIADGLDLGTNARAALITRGLAEIVRLGEALGGRAETFMGLAGLGDLVLTCTGALSRNRKVGLELGRGRSLAEALASLGHVAEGVESARRVSEHARRAGVDMPIAEAVCAVLFDARPPRDAVRQLLAREPRPE
jgi:glycerol-3-phosphate dehydrogenase (NAD(P)+)